MQNTEHKNFTIVVFASGNGSNAARIIDYAQHHQNFSVSTVFSNKQKAPVLEKARVRNIPGISFSKEELYKKDTLKNQLRQLQPDLIVLAGFMWIFPQDILADFPNRVINIHPALLPKYGGKGMYGDHVHKAVLDNKEERSGISIHYVNENYDEGRIIAQYETSIANDETLDSLKQKIHQLEHEYYPLVIEQLLKEQHA
ncbi:MAG: phosphoribosylglycinamide formyltransferase [Psychroflexus sp.]|nr:phosphoribosylglycinamide formyltransferase [Psychroflexus sp.]MDR9447917.1 phosphoribosylglycinamide formyltransferase [Psychroflexus sp.]